MSADQRATALRVLGDRAAAIQAVRALLPRIRARARQTDADRREGRRGTPWRAFFQDRGLEVPPAGGE